MVKLAPVQLREALGELPLAYRDDVVDALVKTFKYGNHCYYHYNNIRARVAEVLVRFRREEAHRDKIIDVLITTLKNKEHPIRARTIEALRHTIERISIENAEIQSPLKLLYYQFRKYLLHHIDKIHDAKKTPTFFGSRISPSKSISTHLSDSLPNVSSSSSSSSSSTSIKSISQFPSHLSFHSSIQLSDPLETSTKPTPENHNDQEKNPKI